MADEWFEFPPVEHHYTLVITGGWELAVICSSTPGNSLKKLPTWVTWMSSADNIVKA